MVILALIKKTSFEKAKKKFPFILRLNQVTRPLNGLVHIQSFSEDIEFEKFYDEENEKWYTLFQIWRTDQIKKKMISGKINGPKPPDVDHNLPQPVGPVLTVTNPNYYYQIISGIILEPSMKENCKMFRINFQMQKLFLW